MISYPQPIHILFISPFPLVCFVLLQPDLFFPLTLLCCTFSLLHFSLILFFPHFFSTFFFFFLFFYTISPHALQDIFGYLASVHTFYILIILLSCLPQTLSVGYFSILCIIYITLHFQDIDTFQYCVPCILPYTSRTLIF